MRLIYPLMWAQPERKADRDQSINTAAALARSGVDVTLLLPRARRDPAVSADDLRRYFAVDGDFRVVQKPSRWEGVALPRTLLWLRQVFRDPQVRAADLLYSRIPVMLGIGGFSPVPFAGDHYRPWPDDWPLIRRSVRRTARDAKCAGVVLHSGYAAEAYRRAGVPDEKLMVAHNGADLRHFAPAMSKRAARAALGLPTERSIAVYAGRINVMKGLDQILALADVRPDTLFLLVGGEEEGPIHTAAARRDNVRIVPQQTPEALPAWLYAADALLIPAASAPLEHFRNCVLPLKLYSYLAAGRPIVAPVAPDTAELLRDGDNALLVPPGEPEAAAAALDRLRDTTLADRLAANALALGTQLTWDARAVKIRDFLEARLANAG
jgi:glycosyltransferase involved in cell wall biosynthesis